MTQPPATVVKAGPTAQDWDARQRLITQLYLEEDKPLKDVMAIVNVDGFKASEKMYKSRFTKWGIDNKNNKEREARAILQLHAQRIGKPTQMSLRGRPVDIGKIESYVKRKGISLDNVLSPDFLLDPSSSSSAKMDLVCRTPSPVASAVEPRATPALNLPALHATPLQISEPWEVLDRTPLPLVASTDMDSRALVSTRSGFHGAPLEENEAWERFQSLLSGTIPRRVEAPDGLKIVESVFVDIEGLVIASAQIQKFQECLSWVDSIGEGFLKQSIVIDGPEHDSGKLLRSALTKSGFGLVLSLLSLLSLLAGLFSRGQRDAMVRLCNNWSMLPSTDKSADVGFGGSAIAQISHRLMLLIVMGEPSGLILHSTLRVMEDTLLTSGIAEAVAPSAFNGNGQNRVRFYARGSFAGF